MAALESHLTTLNQALLRMAPTQESNIETPSQALGDRPTQGSMNGNPQYGTDLTRIPASNASTSSPKDSIVFTSRRSITNKNNAGETSVSHALQRVEDRLTELGLPVVEERASAPQTPPITPLPSHSSELNGVYPDCGILHTLQQHGITPIRQEWDVYLDTFFVEVLALYPFISEEHVREMYGVLWEDLGPQRTHNSDQPVNINQNVQTLLILANGRCATSSRIHSGEGLHSAGWSLYCAAMELQGSLLGMISDDYHPLSSLQTLTLCVRIFPALGIDRQSLTR